MKTKPESAHDGPLKGRLRCLFALITAFAVTSSGPWSGFAVAGVEYPELGEVREIIARDRPPGIVFLVREHSESAYDWVLPRLEHYVALIRERWDDLPVAVVSHGEEIFSLLEDRQPANAGYREKIERLVAEQGVAFQICGSFAALSGFGAGDFVDSVEVVDSAPDQITDYRMIGYRVVHLELTW